MQDLRTQFRNGNAQVTSSKVTITVDGRRLTMPRGTFVHPDMCYGRLLAEGVSTSDAIGAMAVIQGENLPELLREFDPKGSPRRRRDTDRVAIIPADANI